MKLNSRTLPLFSVLFVVIGAAGFQSAFAQETASVPAETSPPPVTTPDGSVAIVPDNNAVVDPSKTNGTAAPQEAPELKILKSIEQEIKKKKGNDIYERSSVPSLVFTPSQYALLREARIGFNTRAPTLQELAKAGDPNDPNYRAPVALRDVRLGGIAYNTPDDWTIWLNSNRVTPDALPAEAIDLRVYKDFIELKWFDATTNQVFPIRLRMNQRFNLDNRIFLPGL
jgi:hypothetical protein